ncbi:MAG: 50S ribosomal protein L18e [Candidatus Thermoplasmatota archaeon]|nr:50S ribosomal protein L18e [Candidatus Thermoplasmatota archaeon]MBS3790756.1 50S ribosomal protein L18e [Candidatus Thermoplasmatota archaeon]
MSEESDMSIEEKTNPNLISLIKELKDRAREKEAPIWRDVAERLERSSKHWAEVNLSSIERNVEEGDTIVVPGKVLGAGILKKEVTIGAFKASRSAEESIAEAGGELLNLRELAERRPEGSDIKIMG